MSVLDDPDVLVPPAFYHCPEYAETLGPEVADLVKLFGRTPNPEQQLLLDGSFGMDRRGKLAAFEVAVFASRQNLKTGFFGFRALGKALLLRRPLQIWTAHKESATDQALLDFKMMIEDSAELSRRVKRVTEGKGSKTLEFTNGCAIVFRPRTGKAGQSMSADDVDMDEYFAVEPKHEGSLIPTLSTRPNAQIGIASSAPHAASKVQRTVMGRGRSAAQGLTHEPRLLYAEWSLIRRTGTTADGRPKYGPPPCQERRCSHDLGVQGCIADDRELIKLSNPSAGRSAAPAISWEYLADERRKLQGEGIEEYFKERLSIGVEDAEADGTNLFGPVEIWEAGETEVVPDGVGALGFALTADGKWAGITGASLVEVIPEHDPEAEPIDKVLVAPILHTQDIDAAIAKLQELQTKYDCEVGLDEGGPAGALIDALEESDVAPEPFTLRRYSRASGKFRARVMTKDMQGAPDPRLLHLVNADLDEAVQAAEWRWVGDNQVIARRDKDGAVDTTLLEAAVIAADLAEQAGTFNIY